ncbi:TauD/TfdA family dioxygenase [Micromonospora zhanjiangensis]|uniref:TauD/TfdA family dioxygenase n=1 Tax=Micromonospora zhanjiangensis TaxID=1522057 RepID=A0ABV8KPB5_9ACTN
MTGESAGLRDLALTEDERSRLSAVVARLARAGSAGVDDAAWQARARLDGCHLPPRLLAAIRGFRYDAGVDGRLTITNLPVGAEALPPTPTVPDSVERVATVPATIAMLVGLQLGEVIAYREEKHGAMVQNVVPVPSLATSQSNGGSVRLEFHTENAFHPDRPHYVGLLCLRPAHEDRVGTQVASVRRAFPLLDEGSRTVLREARFVTATPPSFRSAGESEPHPVLSGSEDDPDLCVDFHATSALDDKADRALAALRAALTRVRCDLVLRPGDMVFLDNRLVVHGRVAFRPRYDGNDRWLHRVFVHLDNRRTRGRRTADGAVLS